MANRPTDDERHALEQGWHASVTAIVAELPGQWQLDLPSERSQHYAYAEVIAAEGLPQGLRICFSLSAYEGRIRITPSVPVRSGNYRSLRDWQVINYKESGPEATVDATRDPKAIAKDAARKVILPYAPLYAKIREIEASDTKTHNATKSLIVELTTRLGRVAHVIGDRKRDPYAAIDEGKSVTLDVRNIAECYGSFTVHAYGSCQLELRSISADQARKIAAFLATLQTTTTETEA